MRKQINSSVGKLRRGYYDTVYGNTAHYTGGKTARDLDMGERVPVVMLEPATWRASLGGIRIAPNGASVVIG